MATRSTKSKATPSPAPNKKAPVTAVKKVAPQKKGAGGRPSKYTARFHVPLAKRLTLLGQTIVQIAEAFEVAEDTIYEWRKQHPQFSEAITCARAEADAQVAEAMFNSALGKWVKETKTRVMKGKNGDEVIEETTTKRFINPDVGAQKHWLHNRQNTLWKPMPEEKIGGDLPPITSVLFQEEDGTVTSAPEDGAGEVPDA